MNKKIAVRVRYKSLYISLPFSKQNDQVLRILENAKDGGLVLVFL